MSQQQDSIAYKLSWEIIAMDDAGSASVKARLALEIACGVANAQDAAEPFQRTMEAIAKSVHDPEMARLLLLYMRRGLR